MSSYNIIVIHICCAGFKSLDKQTDAVKAAKQPKSRKRKEKESSDEDFSDEREGNGSEDDGELAAKIAAQEKQLALTKEALMTRKKVVQAPTAVSNASRAIRPTAKGKGAVELVPTVRAAVGGRVRAAVKAQMFWLLQAVVGQGEQDARMFRLLQAGEGESLCPTCVKTRDQTTTRKRTTRKRTTGDLHRGRVLP